MAGIYKPKIASDLDYSMLLVYSSDFAFLSWKLKKEHFFLTFFFFFKILVMYFLVFHKFYLFIYLFLAALGLLLLRAGFL